MKLEFRVLYTDELSQSSEKRAMIDIFKDCHTIKIQVNGNMEEVFIGDATFSKEGNRSIILENSSIKLIMFSKEQKRDDFYNFITENFQFGTLEQLRGSLNKDISYIGQKLLIHNITTENFLKRFNEPLDDDLCQKLYEFLDLKMFAAILVHLDGILINIRMNELLNNILKEDKPEKIDRSIFYKKFTDGKRTQVWIRTPQLESKHESCVQAISSIVDERIKKIQSESIASFYTQNHEIIKEILICFFIAHNDFRDCYSSRMSALLPHIKANPTITQKILAHFPNLLTDLYENDMNCVLDLLIQKENFEHFRNGFQYNLLYEPENKRILAFAILKRLFLEHSDMFYRQFIIPSENFLLLNDILLIDNLTKLSNEHFDFFVFLSSSKSPVVDDFFKHENFLIRLLNSITSFTEIQEVQILRIAINFTKFHKLLNESNIIGLKDKLKPIFNDAERIEGMLYPLFLLLIQNTRPLLDDILE